MAKLTITADEKLAVNLIIDLIKVKKAITIKWNKNYYDELWWNYKLLQ